MKNIIENRIREFIDNHVKTENLEGIWQEPLFAYASAYDPMFLDLRETVSPTHSMPSDFMEHPRTVITYFLPFNEYVAESNSYGEYSSVEWGKAYVETNRLIELINADIQAFMKEKGFKSTLIPPTNNFDPEKLISDWSQRHVAFIAGLGKFGLHRMLITEKGCCGRIGSIVTNMYLEPTTRPSGEYCLNKHNGTCTMCVKKCVNEALFENEASFDRNRCHDMCLKNGEKLKEVGTADVCGKCLSVVPCSYINPVSML